MNYNFEYRMPITADFQTRICAIVDQMLGDVEAFVWTSLPALLEVDLTKTQTVLKEMAWLGWGVNVQMKDLDLLASKKFEFTYSWRCRGQNYSTETFAEKFIEIYTADEYAMFNSQSNPLPKDYKG